MFLFYLLRRELLPTRTFRFFSIAFWLSVFGVALSVSLLLIVLSVMTGFQKTFKAQYIKMTSHFIALPVTREDLDLVKAELSRDKSVLAFSPFYLGQAMLLFQGKAGGVTLEGIDYKTANLVTPYQDIWTQGPIWEAQRANANWIWIGEQLAKKLNIRLGETLHLFLPEQEDSLRPFVVTAITKFGIYNQDLRFAVIEDSTFSKLYLGMPSALVKVRLRSELQLDATVKKLKETLESHAHFKKWSDVHKNIFEAIEHQKHWLFLILEIIVILAVLNVVNFLLMQAHEKQQKLAILKALGFSKSHILQYFLLQGLLVGCIGTLMGLLIGKLFIYLLQWWNPIQLSESVYNVKDLPFQTSYTDLIWIVGGSLSTCLIFSLWPAVKTVRSEIIGILKYDR